MSSARDSEFGQTAPGERVPTTSRLASHRSYVSRDSALDDPPGDPIDPKELLLRSLLALAPVTDEGGEDALQCAQVSLSGIRSLTFSQTGLRSTSCICVWNFQWNMAGWKGYNTDVYVLNFSKTIL